MTYRQKKEALSWAWCGVMLAGFLYGVARMPGDDVTAEPQHRDFPVLYGRANGCPDGWRLQEGPIVNDTYRCWRIIK
jgi:hypothetical protein